jgi:hypothetical protein
MILQPFVSRYIENSFIQFIIISSLVILISFVFETILQKKINSLLFRK